MFVCFLNKKPLLFLSAMPRAGRNRWNGCRPTLAVESTRPPRSVSWSRRRRQLKVNPRLPTPAIRGSLSATETCRRRRKSPARSTSPRAAPPLAKGGRRRLRRGQGRRHPDRLIITSRRPSPRRATARPPTTAPTSVSCAATELPVRKNLKKTKIYFLVANIVLIVYDLFAGSIQYVWADLMCTKINIYKNISDKLPLLLARFIGTVCKDWDGLMVVYTYMDNYCSALAL